MSLTRVAIMTVALALMAGACGDGTDTSGGATDETVRELQSEINRLKAALDLATTGTTSATLATETTLGTGTTVPTAGATELLPIFDEVLTALAERTNELGARATQANTAWENQASTYEATHAVFTDVKVQALALSLAAAELPIPPELQLRYEGLLTAFQELADSAASLVTGLEAPDDGTLRKAAADRVSRWVIAVQDAAEFG
ncbi:hypothetical protein HQ535_11095 [bacterium]|nr:hypothetical protein [bacterium]